MNTKELIEQAIALPVEERALVVDSLLRSLNSPQPEIDAQWAAEAKRRLSELRSGKVQTVPGEAVFERIWERFQRGAIASIPRPS
jgi:putative addiction module component (TIGR02574 family)